MSLMVGGNVNLRGIARSAALASAVVVATVGLGAGAAFAATEQEVASWIADSALDKLGLQIEDAELRAALEASIAEALAAGLISAAIEDVAEDAVDDPDSVPDAEIDDTLKDELDDQTGAWDDVKAQWHTAFDEIKAEFAACREAAEGGADLCAHQFRYDMRVNHVEAWQARHAATLGDVAALPTAEQEAALAELERQGAHAAAQLERARVQLEKKTGLRGDETEPGEANAPIEDAPAPVDTVQPGTERGDKGQKPAKNNKGGNGNGKSDR